ncbi:F-box protein At2g27310-like [Mercurialis annua]|uniref:F-box protein At2g27310-like n=1 Tax=Mercurialis annua TaxID=3986 RepID=UPI00215DF15C|nr:F-box protein At2g27310-like [Mercurialis annua]
MASSTINQDGGISTVYHDILHTHILTRLDGPTLASLSCVSSEFYSLSTHHQLWRNISDSTWPSIKHPLVAAVISSFPSAYRSFFSDSYPFLHHPRRSIDALDQTTQFQELISAVDVYYQNVPVFSEVEKIETESADFLRSPFRVDILPTEEFVPKWIQLPEGEQDLWSKKLEENLTLSWILIDPKEKRAVNMSSKRAVSVEKHWLTGEMLIKFATVLTGGETDGGLGREHVACEIVVTCRREEGGEVRVRDVSMTMEDIEGISVRGRDSLVILKEVMQSWERKILGDGEEGRRRYKEFLRRKGENYESQYSVANWMCNVIRLLNRNVLA